MNCYFNIMNCQVKLQNKNLITGRNKHHLLKKWGLPK